MAIIKSLALTTEKDHGHYEKAGQATKYLPAFSHSVCEVIVHNWSLPQG